MTNMSFGERLKTLRREKIITQEQLASELEKLGCGMTTKSAISQYENNKRIPDMKSLVIIASFFNVTTDFLMCSSSCDQEESRLILYYRSLDDKRKSMVGAYTKALYDGFAC